MTESRDGEGGLRKKGYDLLWGSLLRTTTVAHRVLYRASKGRLGRRFPGGQQVVWIVTLGRKSGQWRRNPLLAVADTLPSGESAWVVTGSNAGQAKVPGWVFNARDNAAGFIEIDGAFFRATFVEAVGHDRDDLYERLTQIWSSYAMYADHAGRYIPVFRVVVGEPVTASEVPA